MTSHRLMMALFFGDLFNGGYIKFTVRTVMCCWRIVHCVIIILYRFRYRVSSALFVLLVFNTSPTTVFF